MVSEAGSTAIGRPPPIPRSELSHDGMTGIDGYMGGIDAVRDAGEEREVEQERYHSAVADFRDRIGKAEANILARDRMLQELEARLRHRQRYPDSDRSSVVSPSVQSQSPSLMEAASRREASRAVSDTTADMTGSTLESGELLVRPRVPLLFDSSHHPLPVSVPRTGIPGSGGHRASARSNGSGNVPRSPFTPDQKRADNTITRQTRAAVVGEKGDDAQMQLFRSGPPAQQLPVDDSSDEGGSKEVDWPFILGAAGAGLLLGGGIGWLCTHSMYAGTAKLAPAGVHSVTVGGGAGPPVPWSVAAAGASTVGHKAGGKAAVDAMLKAAAASGKVGGKAVMDANAAGATAAAAAASKSLAGATAAALATPFVVPAIPMPFLTVAGASGATLITGAAVGSGVGAVTAGGAGYAIQAVPAAQ